MQRQRRNVGRRSSTPVKVNLPITATPAFTLTKSNTQSFLQPVSTPASHLKKISHVALARREQERQGEEKEKKQLRLERPETGKKASESTKPGTRLDRLTIHSKSQTGLRGMSFKYEVTPSLGLKQKENKQGSGFRTRPYTSKHPIQQKRNQSTNRNKPPPF